MTDPAADDRAPDELDPPAGAPAGPSTRWLTPGVPGVLGVGGASLCSDTGHELVTALLPTFVTSTLHVARPHSAPSAGWPTR